LRNIVFLKRMDQTGLAFLLISSIILVFFWKRMTKMVRQGKYNLFIAMIVLILVIRFTLRSLFPSQSLWREGFDVPPTPPPIQSVPLQTQPPPLVRPPPIRAPQPPIRAPQPPIRAPPPVTAPPPNVPADVMMGWLGAACDGKTKLCHDPLRCQKSEDGPLRCLPPGTNKDPSKEFTRSKKQ
jgi:hypothetical protein